MYIALVAIEFRAVERYAYTRKSDPDPDPDPDPGLSKTNCKKTNSKLVFSLLKFLSRMIARSIQ